MALLNQLGFINLFIKPSQLIPSVLRLVALPIGDSNLPVSNLPVSSQSSEGINFYLASWGTRLCVQRTIATLIVCVRMPMIALQRRWIGYLFPIVMWLRHMTLTARSRPQESRWKIRGCARRLSDSLAFSLLVEAVSYADRGSVILAEAQNDTFYSFLSYKMVPI